MEIGEAIRLWREAQIPPWSQGQLSRRSGVPQPTISRIEARAHKPGYDTMVALAEAFGLGIDELVVGPTPQYAQQRPVPVTLLRQLGWTDARIGRFARRWEAWSVEERARWLLRLHALNAERDQIEDARRLIAEVDALNAEFDQIDSPEGGQHQIVPPAAYGYHAGTDESDKETA